jgi:membrane protein DedA with SNARE-associated domain
MLKMLKFVEYVWVGVAFVCAFEFSRVWNKEDEMKYIFGAGVIVAIFMFFLRRFTRKKYETIQAEKAKNETP